MPVEKNLDSKPAQRNDVKKWAWIIFIVTLVFFIAVICIPMVLRSQSTKSTITKYYVHEKLENWFGALDACHSLDMKLISIESEEKQKEIENAIKDAGLESVDFWTSGTKADNNGVFYWKETGHNFTYTNWASGEPNEWDFMNPEECMNLMSSASMKWNDVPCHFEHNVICESQL